MEAILDSNFIIACVRRKIDFIKQIEEHGFRVLLPLEVYQELKDLKDHVSHEDKIAIDIALEIFDKHGIEKIRLGAGKTVDQGLIDQGKKGKFIATLDNGIKKIVPNRIIIFSAQNKIGIE
jgi:rRNA-processing protein FCF1